MSECKLCLAKRQLEAYECVIFDKKLIENSDELETIIRGTWKPSYQECILKSKFFFCVCDCFYVVRKEIDVSFSSLNSHSQQYKICG